MTKKWSFSELNYGFRSKKLKICSYSEKEDYIHAPHIHNTGSQCCGSGSSISSESGSDTGSESGSRGWYPKVDRKKNTAGNFFDQKLQFTYP
jgi:hypothetical protein